MEYIKLNKLCDINIGKTPSRNKEEYWGKGAKWLSIADLKDKYISTTKEEITDKAIKECNMKIVLKDTVVMSFKLSIGKTAILEEDMYTNEAIANFPIKDKNVLLPEYLYYALKTLNFNNTDRAVMGATLNKAKLNELIIPYCKIDIQKNIVQILNKSRELIDKRKAQIEALDELVKSQFIEMFGDPISNTKNLNMKNFEEVVRLQRGFDLPTYERDENGDINVWGANGILSKHNTYKVNEPGVVTGRSGSLGNVYYTMEPYWPLNTTLFSKNTFGNNVIYLAYLLRFYKLNRFANGTGVPTLNRNLLDGQKIIDVPIELQNQFADFVKQVDKLKFEMQNSLDEMQNNFDSLMQKAFNGELFKEDEKILETV